MKKSLKNALLAGLFIAISSVLLVGCSDDDDDDLVINPTELPAAAHAFVSTHFEGLTIVRAEKDHKADLNGGIYDIDLSNGTEIEFDIDGNWTEVDCIRQAVPASVMVLAPESISTYAAEKYPTLIIVELKKQPYGYSIELINDLDIHFNHEGGFLYEKW